MASYFDIPIATPRYVTTQNNSIRSSIFCSLYFCPGEFRRCYNDDELIQVLGWYEIFASIGMNIGPGLPVVFTLMDIHIGWWKIDKYNAIQFFMAVFTFFIFFISCFKVTNLSKELEEIKAKYSVPSTLVKHKEEKDVTENEITKRRLMPVKDLFQIDILSLCFSYGIMRYIVSTAVAFVTMNSVSMFHWNSNTLSWLHVGVGSISYFLITLSVRFGVFKGRRKTFFLYVIALILGAMILSVLMLPREIKMTQLKEQFLFATALISTKCFVYFQAQTSEKFLLFHTVTHDNANLVDGFRSIFGNVFRILAKITSYLFVIHPEFFSPPLVIFDLFIIATLLCRKSQHIRCIHS